MEGLGRSLLIIILRISDPERLATTDDLRPVVQRSPKVRHEIGAFGERY